MAFSVQLQLFTGMRFLGLIDDKNKPTDDLVELTVQDEGARKHKLQEVLQNRYAELFALNLKKTTPDELDKKMTEAYSVTGETRERAVRFFLGAVTYLGIEVSPLLAGKKANGAPRVPPGKKRTVRKLPPAPLGNINTPEHPAGTSKTVRLQSGGMLTLSATLDLFSLNPEDRKFIFELIDKLEGYAQPDEAPSPTTE